MKPKALGKISTKASQLFLTLTLTALTPLAAAVDFDVTIDNTTRGLYFTPLAVVAHPPGTNLFRSGTSASSDLQAMAETGDIAALETTLTTDGATMDNNPAGGLLAPGASTTSTLNTINAAADTQLSVVAMILPSNDGFIGLNAVDIPAAAGTYTFYANAYDAGTEANDELRGGDTLGTPGFPVPGPLGPLLGTGGTGVANTIEGFIHIHRGNLGDTTTTAGNSDINSAVHRWLNPVARITITVR